MSSFRSTVHVRTVRRVLVAAAAGGVIAGTGLLWAGDAEAVPPGPNSCVSGSGGFIGGGGFEDCDLWPDGSFWHRWWGWGPFASGGGSFRACDGLPPVPTDNDPSTPC